MQLNLFLPKYIIFNWFCQIKCRNHYIRQLNNIVLLARKAEVVVLVWKVFITGFEPMEPPVDYLILLGISTLLALMKKLIL